MSNVEELITNVKDDDLVSANKAFDQLMSQKINAVMDAKKVELGSSVIDRVKEKQED
jgi:hypothetical protein